MYSPIGRVSRNMQVPSDAEPYHWETGHNVVLIVARQRASQPKIGPSLGREEFRQGTNGLRTHRSKLWTRIPMSTSSMKLKVDGRRWK